MYPNYARRWPIDYENFDWDAGNLAHITDFTPEEIEEAVLDPDRVPFSAYNQGSESRKALVGRTGEGDLLYVVYTIQSKKVRVITARDAEPAERRRYRKRGK